MCVRDRFWVTKTSSVRAPSVSRCAFASCCVKFTTSSCFKSCSRFICVRIEVFSVSKLEQVTPTTTASACAATRAFSTQTFWKQTSSRDALVSRLCSFKAHSVELWIFAWCFISFVRCTTWDFCDVSSARRFVSSASLFSLAAANASRAFANKRFSRRRENKTRILLRIQMLCV